MKIFAAIMAIILLAQSLIPCADKENISAKGKVQIAQSIHHQNNDEQDDCPPLCSCSCCGCSASSFNVISYNFINAFSILRHGAEYLPSPIQGINLPIWQPPKLSDHIIS